MGEEQWVFRRDDRIRRPRHALTVGSDSGIPVIAPEVQLLYMATSLDVKNEGDFDNASEQLDQRSARWLSGALAHAHPDHPWLARLPAT
jgi:hypothetical protein